MTTISLSSLIAGSDSGPGTGGGVTVKQLRDLVAQIESALAQLSSDQTGAIQLAATMLELKSLLSAYDVVAEVADPI